MAANLLAGFAALSAGLVSGGALCALYIALGVFTKPAARLGLDPTNGVGGTFAAVGAAAGTVVTLFGFHWPVGGFFAGVSGLFAGIYTGILIACLAEVADSIPLLQRFGVSVRSIVWILLTFAAGKLLGSLVYWLIW